MNEFNGDKVISISCGGLHSLALTENGNVYSWGHNEYGQLGRNCGEENHSSYPKLIELYEEIFFDSIACGPLHSLLLSRNIDIYVFRNNSNHELGINGKHILPLKKSSSHKFTEIAAHFNYAFSCALSTNGIYYIWGKVSENEINRKPKGTQFNTFNEIMHYFGITYKTICNE